jgi:aminopeptidase
MKRTQLLKIIFVIAAFVSAAIFVNAQTEDKTRELAVRLMQSASVKPGDVVVVNGGKHMIELMEAVAIEAQKAGGQVHMFLNSDRVSRSLYTEVPEKYLEQEPRYFAEWIKQTNVYINLPTSEDPKSLIANVPDARFAKINKSFEFFTNLLNSFPVRVVSIDFPTAQDAALNGMDFPTYQKMMMNAISADYKTISVKGNQLKQMLQNARQIKVTNPAGTDFTFSPAAGREIYVDDGIVTEEKAKSKLFAQRIAALPGGNVFFAPLETSANGKVVVVKDTCKYTPMTGITFEFKNGMMQNFKAATNGNCFQEAMQSYTGPKEMFGAFWIGLNPALRVVEEGNANFRPFNAAGAVNIGLGDNRLYGGNNKTVGGYSFSITNATVTIDGKTVIKDGKLQL